MKQRCQLLLYKLTQQVKTFITTWRKPSRRWSKKMRRPGESHRGAGRKKKRRWSKKNQTNSEYASNQTVYNDRNTSSGKALGCWFFIFTTSSKPCSNLNSRELDRASRCDTILKESSINFFFLSAATVDFLRCLNLGLIELWNGF